VKSWQKILIPTAFTLLIGAIYLFSVWKQRQDPGVVAQSSAQKLSADDLAVVRELFPAHFEDTIQLEGSTVWMKNGYTISYFPATFSRIDFAHPAGVLPSIQRLEIKKILKSAVPASLDDGVGHGSQQVFAVFALPGQSRLFALPIGVIDGDDEAYYCDVLFFYDDPHTIYDNWSKDTWAAIDAHQVKPGMSELQTRLAIGQNMHPSSSQQGNRTIAFNQASKHWTVTFVDNRATTIQGL
jgi:hypothetical protein